MAPAIAARPSATAELRLRGGRALPFLAACVLALAACAPQAAAPPASATPAAPSPTGIGGRPAVPTLGSPPPSGLVFPTYFVTILESRNGHLLVVTSPGSKCTLGVTLPDASPYSAPELAEARDAGADGRATFAYTPVPPRPGRGIHTVACELRGQRDEAKARFDIQ